MGGICEGEDVVVEALVRENRSGMIDDGWSLLFDGLGRVRVR